MSRRNKMEVGGLNIRLHPHSADIYKSLFDFTFKSRIIGKVHGDRYGIISSLSRRSSSDDWIDGVISTFAKVDLRGEWLNIETLGEATKEDLKSISLPSHLLPNVKIFRFRFFVKKHILVFEHYSDGSSLSHQSALRFFKNIYENEKILKKFGKAKVSIIQEKGSISKLFSIPRITNLQIFIEKPNSDIWEEDFEDHLEAKNARSVKLEYKSEPGQGIERDASLDHLITASLSNGFSVAKGYGPNGHLKVTTQSYPKIVLEKFDEITGAGNAFIRLANRFVN